MHELVTRIKDAELCYVFARNATRKGHPELALQALRRAVELKAESQAPGSDAERAAFSAIYAYEEALSHQKGKRTRATGTWQLVNKHGILPTLARRAGSKAAEEAQETLKLLKMEDYSFDAIASTLDVELKEAA